MADNIANIVARVSTQAANGTQEFTIALKPDHLGKLSIKLIMDTTVYRRKSRPPTLPPGADPE
jgi:hypothetical protein